MPDFVIDGIRHFLSIKRSRFGYSLRWCLIGGGFIFCVSFFLWEEGEGLDEDGQKTIKKTIEKTIKKNSQKILDLVRQNPKITTEELAKATGLSSVGVRYNLNKLKKENVLKRIGPDKGGHWEVL